MSVRETGASTELSLVYGRVGFRLPSGTRVEIRTPTARLLASGRSVTTGEVFVGGDGTTGVRTTQGDLRVHELGGEQRTLLASIDPVFVPRRPVASGPLFSGEGPVAAPTGAKAVFNPQGESLGYLRPGAQLVVHPGYTSDLTRPFPAKLVQLAAATIPEGARSDAVPLFDVNGGYVGYLAGTGFYAQAQVAQGGIGGGGGAAGGLGAGGWTLIVLGAGGLVAGSIIGAQCAAGNSPCGDGTGTQVVATSLRPKR